MSVLSVILLSGLLFQDSTDVIPEEPGTYFVEIIVEEDSSVSKIIEVTVLLPTSIEDETNNIAIDASDFVVSESEWKNITDLSILKRSNAKAWDTKTGEPQSISVISRVEVNSTSFAITLQSKTSQKVIHAYIFQNPTVSYTYNNYQVIQVSDSLNPFKETMSYIIIFLFWLLIPIVVILFLLFKLSFFNKKVTSLLYRKDKEDNINSHP